MMINTSFLMSLISGFIIFSLSMAFLTTVQRLHLTGAAKMKFLTRGSLFLGLWIAWIVFGGLSEIFSNFESFPPPFMIFFFSILISAFLFAFSNLGLALAKALTYQELIFFQGFRLFVEITLVIGAKEGLTPQALTLHGWNFDIITGISAIFLGSFINRTFNLKYIKIWNTMGLGFLAIVTSVGFLSLPTPIRVFMDEPSNIWITTWPYILLPGLLVWSALLGHLLLIRKIRLDPKSNIFS